MALDTARRENRQGAEACLTLCTPARGDPMCARRLRGCYWGSALGGGGGGRSIVPGGNWSIPWDRLRTRLARSLTTSRSREPRDLWAGFSAAAFSADLSALGLSAAFAGSGTLVFSAA